MKGIFWSHKKGTYADNKNIYSVDLIFLYVNNRNLVSKKIKIKKLIPQLKKPDWTHPDDPTKNISPINVIKKYQSSKDYQKIKKADLRFPIIIDHKYNIIDGMHRLSKAYLLKKASIRAYIFDQKIMKKFIIGSKSGKNWSKKDWKYYESLTKKNIEKLYRERFVYKPIVWRDHGTYDVKKLWTATDNLPTSIIKINKLIHNLDKDLWTIFTDDRKEKYVTPNQVIKNPHIAPKHYKAIQDADLSFPLIIYDYNNDLDVLDGLHRLAKLYLLDKKTVKVKFANNKILKYAKVSLR